MGPDGTLRQPRPVAGSAPGDRQAIAAQPARVEGHYFLAVHLGKRAEIVVFRWTPAQRAAQLVIATRRDLASGKVASLGTNLSARTFVYDEQARTTTGVGMVSGSGSP